MMCRIASKSAVVGSGPFLRRSRHAGVWQRCVLNIKLVAANLRDEVCIRLINPETVVETGVAPLRHQPAMGAFCDAQQDKGKQRPGIQTHQEENDCADA